MLAKSRKKKIVSEPKTKVHIWLILFLLDFRLILSNVSVFIFKTIVINKI